MQGAGSPGLQSAEIHETHPPAPGLYLVSSTDQFSWHNFKIYLCQQTPFPIFYLKISPLRWEEEGRGVRGPNPRPTAGDEETCRDSPRTRASEDKAPDGPSLAPKIPPGAPDSSPAT